MALNLYSSSTTDTLLAAKVDLAGGTMTGALTLSASGIIFSDATYLTTAPAGSTLAADQLTAGVVTANPSAGPTAAGDVLQYNGSALIWAAGGGGGGLTISSLSNGATSTLDSTVPSAGYVLSFDGTNLIWSAAAGSAVWGGITGVVTDQTDLVSYISGLGYIGEAPIDGTPYVRKNGAWDPNTSPVGSVDWSAITGNVTDSTSLMVYLPANYYPLTGNPSGFLTSVPAPSVSSTVSSSYSTHTLAAGDTNNIVHIDNASYVTIYIPTDGTYDFPIGTTVRLAIENASYITVYPQDYGMGGPYINGATTNTPQFLTSSGSQIVSCVKVAANRWVVS
jgi:hypothetical protein